MPIIVLIFQGTSTCVCQRSAGRSLLAQLYNSQRVVRVVHIRTPDHADTQHQRQILHYRNVTLTHQIGNLTVSQSSQF